MRRTRLLVVQHDADKGLGLLEQTFLEAGLGLDVRFAGQEPLGVDEHSGVVALPGLADPVDETPAIDETRSILAAALGRGLPVLGVCLGAELLAEAAGGTTAPCEPEYGFHRVALCEPAATDPLLAHLPPAFDVFQAHAFGVSLPPDGTALAESAVGVQAFRVGERAWGIQFHPEPTPAMLTSWIATVGARLEEQGLHPADVAEQGERMAPVSAVRAAGIARGFAAVLASPKG